MAIIDSRRLVLIASVLGFLGVALGAFGAHGLESTLEANGRMDTFGTASEYHMLHALALLAAAWLAAREGAPAIWARRAGLAFLLGTLLFSGSLYLLAILDVGIFGAIAPIGGTLLLIGWGCTGMAAWHSTGG